VFLMLVLIMATNSCKHFKKPIIAVYFDYYLFLQYTMIQCVLIVLLEL